MSSNYENRKAKFIESITGPKALAFLQDNAVDELNTKMGKVNLGNTKVKVVDKEVNQKARAPNDIRISVMPNEERYP